MVRGGDAHPDSLFVDELITIKKKDKHVKSAIEGVEVWKEFAADMFNITKDKALKEILEKYLDEKDSDDETEQIVRII